MAGWDRMKISIGNEDDFNRYWEEHQEERERYKKEYYREQKKRTLY